MKGPMRSAAPKESVSADVINDRAHQLYSILHLICGEGYEAFDRYNDNIKTGVLWACADLAGDIKWHSENLGRHLMEKQTQEES